MWYKLKNYWIFHLWLVWIGLNFRDIVKFVSQKGYRYSKSGPLFFIKLYPFRYVMRYSVAMCTGYTILRSSLLIMYRYRGIFMLIVSLFSDNMILCFKSWIVLYRKKYNMRKKSCIVPYDTGLAGWLTGSLTIGVVLNYPLPFIWTHAGF